eukprot:TRINITY_DN154_c0_g3_i1.p1 TRINITY_DN154_c0_g3~~TRINITY_DN154_c0_g3_i1.p1  ORF type:complete len:1355 (+),score=115.99 TRINITY_DN154_c0_g3_i1:491-4066(+)
MQINREWTNPEGEWRVGMKRAFDLFPKSLVQRIKQKRKQNTASLQAVNITNANSELNKWYEKHGKDSSKLSEEQKKQQAELELRVKMLSDLEQKAEDLGPVIHCVVWNDGQEWRAALDTSELYPHDVQDKGLLKDFIPLTNFRKELKYGTFSDLDQCNFGLNIYNNGDILEIVVDTGSHGTHVAGIIAGNYPNNPSLNGIAPGAQIISCKIGDSRFSGMETGTGLTRAVIAAINHKVDLINMSYGEPTSTPNKGRFIEIAEEAVYRQGIIFVSSAGNNGPALTTVGAPGGTASCMFSVGAYLSPQMATVAHSHNQELKQGFQYTWSSRGPTPDGDQGVMISAPGGAIAPVPQWSTSKKQLMNGTSMSSPNACGAIALILSYLQANKLDYSPSRIRRAVCNTASPMYPGLSDSPLTYGSGLLQVPEAVKFLDQGYQYNEMDVRYDISVVRIGSNNNNSNGLRDRGIYVRDISPDDLDNTIRYRCEIKPKVHEDASVETMLAIEHELVLNVVYHSYSAVSWVQAPTAMMLHHGGRNIDVSIDLSQLNQGEVYYAEIVAEDAEDAQLGALFRIPITVVVPIIQDNQLTHIFGTRSLYPGKIVRDFIQVPQSATWAELTIGPARVQGVPKQVFVAATQILPQSRYTEGQMQKVVLFTEGDYNYFTFPVQGGYSLEITLAQYWSSPESLEANVQIEFHSIQSSSPQTLFLDGAAGITSLLVSSPLRSEKLSPTIKLKELCIPLKPSETQLKPLETERDTLPRNRVIHQLIMTYKFSLAESGKITPKCPMINRWLYDGLIEAQIYMIFDSNEALVGQGEVYPESHQLQKGDYTLKLMVRHDNVDLLEKFKMTNIILHKSLEKEITVPVYQTYLNAVQNSGSGNFKDKTLRKGDRMKLFIGPVSEEGLPKDAKPKILMAGTLNLGKCSTTVGGGASPCKTDVYWTVPPIKESKNDKGNGSNKEESVQDKFSKAVRDTKVKFIKDMDVKDKKEYMTLYQDIKSEYPEHLPLLLEHLKKVESVFNKLTDEADKLFTHDDVLKAADNILTVIGEPRRTELAKFVAEKCPSEEEGADERKKEMEQVKESLITALACTARVLIKQDKPEFSQKLDETFKELRKWVDTTEEPHQLLHAKREMMKQRYAQAVGILDKIIDNKEKLATKEVWELKRQCFEKLGWKNWEISQYNIVLDKFPKVKQLF